MAAQDLCTLANVREALEIPTADTSRDVLIGTLIPAASVAIMSEVDRELAPATASATRRFRVDDYKVSLAPYDLRTAATVTLHPESTSPITLVAANNDYQLLPVGAPSGTYTSLAISGFSVLVSDTAFRFGYALLDVAGAWGFATVPLDVTRACVLTVSSWLRRDVTALALQSDAFIDSRGLAPSLPSSFAIPGDAKRLLSAFYRLSTWVPV